jgi:hypothetical protein
MQESNVWNKSGHMPLQRENSSKAVRMASVDDYQRYAEQCLALALKSTNPADKARLLQMAQAWRDLAEKRDTGDLTKDPPE